MAGYLSSENVTYAPVTWGRTTDFEVRAAAEVAAALGIVLCREPREPDEAEFLQAAQIAARWEHLAAGFGGLEAWAGEEFLTDTAPYFWSGIAVDAILGGFGPNAGRDSGTNTWSFGCFLRKSNRWGLAPVLLKQLLRIPPGNEILEQHLESWRCDYDRADLSGSQRAFLGELSNRVRFHIGAILHRLSFRSWPLLPIFDRRLLHLLFNADADALSERRLELALLGRCAPHLAAIPFDTNSFRFSPSQVKLGRVTASWATRAKEWFAYRARRWYWRHWRKIEPRRYFRLYDLNSPYWHAVRCAAETCRSSVYDLLDRELFDQLLPPPSGAIKYSNPFAEGAARRTLLGLLLWNVREADCLESPTAVEAP